MTNPLVKLFVKDYKDVENENVREKYATVAGFFGIACNMLLFALKLTAGLITASVSIISDAFNNLSDCGSSLVTIIGAKLANRRPDREHPFGHGRYEYISSIIVAFLILTVGIQLGKSSIENIISPTETEFSVFAICVLSASILVKLLMFFTMRNMGKSINSEVLTATATDSINDVITTAVVLAASILSRFSDFPFDGVAGLIVSLFILWGGFGIARDTIGVLLGKSPSQQMVDKIASYLKGNPEIIGIHDMIIHDYGPGRSMCTVHAEVPDTCDIVQIHEVIDEIETRIFNETGIHTVIHMDPVAVNDPENEKHKAAVKSAVRSVDPEFTIHDFRFVRGQNHINLIFDLVVPTTLPTEKYARLKADINAALKKTDPRYCAVITIDIKYYK